jgi:beta-glucosidase
MWSFVQLLLLFLLYPGVAAQGSSPPAGCGQMPPVQEPPLAHRPWMNAQLPAAERTRLLLNAMNMSEQIRMLYGNDKPVCGGQRGYTGYVVGNERLGIPHLQMNDGPQGFRVDGGDTTTAWPSGINMAASWDEAAVAAWGRGMGMEFAAKGANVQLGPGLCVNRIPNCGRAFEYLSGEVGSL